MRRRSPKIVSLFDPVKVRDDYNKSILDVDETRDELLVLARQAADVESMDDGEDGPFGDIADRDARRLLVAFTVAGGVPLACNAAGVGYKRHQRWMGDVEGVAAMPGYREAFALAREMAADMAESEVRRRALVGWLKPVYQRGVLVGHERKHSDSLLIEWLAAYRPERWGRRHRTVEHTGAGGGPITSLHVHEVRGLSDDDLLALVGRAAPALSGGLLDAGDESALDVSGAVGLPESVDTA